MKTYLGLVGTNGAGKTAVCDYLTKQGFTAISLSDIVRKITQEKNLEPTRDNLVATANELKTTQGQDILAKLTLKEAQNLKTDKIVFDSIRNTSEITYLKNHSVNIIGIDAPIKLRYERITKRQRATDQIDFETFKSHDQRENTGQSPGQNIHQSLQLCQTILDNTKDLPHLHHQISRIINA